MSNTFAGSTVTLPWAGARAAGARIADAQDSFQVLTGSIGRRFQMRLPALRRIARCAERNSAATARAHQASAIPSASFPPHPLPAQF